MPIQTFKSHVKGIRDLTHDVREIKLRVADPPEIAFKAGQYISFEIHRDGLKFPLMRPYSIASPPREKQEVTLVLNLVPEGPGSTFLFSLTEGQETQFKGPAGAFYLREDPMRDLLFVATGTGIAPFLAMIPTWLERRTTRAATLYWGVRSQRDLYYQDELAALARAYPNFRFTTTLSRPEDGWKGEVGRVTRLVEERVISVNNLAVYLCGSEGMIKDVTQILNAKGLCPIYREKFY